MKRMIGLVACDPNGVIGKDGKLPWHYPEDLEHFYQLSLGQVMIMGYKTYKTLPPKYRKTSILYVLSKNHHIEDEGVTQIQSPSEIPPSDKIQYVIGGGEIFNLFFEKQLLQSAIITHIKKTYDGDAFFPVHYIQRWNRSILKETEDFTIIHHYTGYNDNGPQQF